MFGFGDEFEYLECGRCGCLQLRHPPADPTRFYPDDYYAFRSPNRGGIVQALKRVRLRHAFGRPSLLGAMLVRRFGLPLDLAAIRREGADPSLAVLDVGCGDARLLRDLRDAGFRDLTGIDPFLPAGVVAPDGIRIRRVGLAELDGSFDLVLINHAFEHMPDPGAALGHTARVLRPGGRALIRIPVAGSFAWREYGSHWVQLDAPRHLFLHTRRSLELLAERAGLRVRSVHYDSTAFQFWASEQYRRDIPLVAAGATGDAPRAGLFSTSQLREFARRAAQLNAEEDGDQACFCLVKA